MSHVDHLLRTDNVNVLFRCSRLTKIANLIGGLQYDFVCDLLIIWESLFSDHPIRNNNDVVSAQAGLRSHRSFVVRRPLPFLPAASSIVFLRRTFRKYIRYDRERNSLQCPHCALPRVSLYHGRIKRMQAKAAADLLF